ncbi:heat shock 70 kDa protein 3-like [Papaver somniferum]|uniref:heat shock 70 kDa protein 3-like n=1 Tax=Papaver somniferum TaxID=3469 RepID=UPI000E6FC7CD|nr:heat shock 70 kDa protein 3-like [Papaver somniferum]
MKSGSKNVITVKNNKGKLSSDEIKRMVQDSEKYKEDDEKHRKKVDLRNTFETYAIKMRSMISNNGGMLSSKDKKNIKNAVNNAVQWLESSELGKTDDIIDKMKALQNLCDPIVDKLYQQGDTDSPPSTRSGSVASKFSKILRSFGFL